MTPSNPKQTIPPIKGLVLTGGKSSRMGTDKSELNYNGKPQREFVKELLEANGMVTFYSVGSGMNVISTGTEKSQVLNVIRDVFHNIGPMGGICSAFQKHSNSAWFVLATDLPFINDDLVKLLLERRNPTKMATSVQGKKKGFLEPLIAIYEQKMFPILKQSLEEGNLSPSKILSNFEVEIVEVDDEWVQNVNTQEEYKEVKKRLRY